MDASIVYAMLCMPNNKERKMMFVESRAAAQEGWGVYSLQIADEICFPPSSAVVQGGGGVN